MNSTNEIFLKIKISVLSTEPNAIIMIYGSYARGEQKSDSDLDVLILLDNPKITHDIEKKIKYPLYDIEFDTGLIISPLVFSKKDWETRHKITPFFENVTNEGIIL
jgi:predicted nucleotidyltransferase